MQKWGVCSLTTLSPDWHSCRLTEEANGMLRVAAEISCRECALKTELQQDIKSPLTTHCKSQP